MKLRPFALLFVMMTVGCGALFAGTTGKIIGQVKDANSGEPLPAVNIIIENTFLGASTDLDGAFMILNVPPGVYEVRANYIGYRDVVVTGVSVSVDKTTTVNFELSESVVESEAVEVVAEKPLIKKDLTSTESIISSQEIENLPVASFSDVVNLQAGVVEGHFRGGRTGEVVYLVNGVSVNDAYSGSFAIEVENNAIQELSVISGTFNAEYGQAMSGIVNIVTKEGSDKLEGNLSAYTGDYLSTNDDIFWNVDAFNPVYNIQGDLSGRVPGIRKLKFFASGRYLKSDGYLFGRDVFSPTDASNFNSDASNDWVISAKGETYAFSEETAANLIESADFLPMNSEERYTGNLKLIFQLSSRDKLILDGIYQNRNWREYDHRFKLNPEGDYRRDQESYTGMFLWNRVFSSRTFMDLRASLFKTDYFQRVFDEYLGDQYASTVRLQDAGANAFLTGGQQMWHFERSTKTMLFKPDIISQVNKFHQLKLGAEFKQHELQMSEFEVLPDVPSRIAPLTSFNHNQYTRKPVEFAVYLQDKMELNDLVINAGLRYDYFDPDGDIPTDFRQPSETEYRAAGTSSQISPRIGIAHSISASGKIHISYGHFFQIPNFFYLYVNPEFDIFPLQSTPSPPPQSLLNTVGNAELKPQKTVIYEIGLQQQMGTDFGVSLTAFNKDIRNLLGVEVLQTIQGQKYGRYINRDYGFVRGITLEVTKRHNAGVSATIDYTYQVARGNASDPNTAFLDAQTDPPNETEKEFVPLDWDRTHQINATLTMGDLGNYALSIIGRYGSGLPYTPTFQNVQTAIENSARRPSVFNVDAYIYKNLKFGGYGAQLFLRVFNLFDRKNERDVYSDTGRAGYTLAPLYTGGLRPRGVNTLDEYFVRPDFYAPPRQIQVGMEFKF